MAITRIEKASRPTPTMHRVVVHDRTVYVCGVIAKDCSADVSDQSRQIFQRIDDFLDHAGTSRENLLQVQIWLKDIGDFHSLNAVWEQWIDADTAPVRACVEATMARPDILVEVMVTAALP